MVTLLEEIHQASILLLLVCSFLYYRHLKKIKRERELTPFEFSMFIVTQLAYLLWAGSYLLLFLDKG
ncbi:MULTISPECIES: hypothetical protein [Bacillaceae]|uniref:hypothetical protein n=1 Tax=Bacillaceae TaxID=186817 RepID=UPI0011A6D1D8|nr:MULTISPECIES: hypothetical protein [Bacillaceae]MED4473871.1 hypothetical protein [Oceanobacillus caeni]